MNGFGVAARVATGAVCGLAWASALRAYMVEIAGYSTFTWAGTFIGILLPGVVMGAAIGAATAHDGSLRRQRIALRWCAAAVLGFAVFPMLMPGSLLQLLTTGLGGGAIAVALAGLAGGYAFGGRRTWLRVIGAIVAAVVICGVMATVPAMGGAILGITTPRGVWVILLVGSLLALLCLAVAVPFRRLSTPKSHPTTPRGEPESVKSFAASHHHAE